MKVLLVNGSPHKKGCSIDLVNMLKEGETLAEHIESCNGTYNTNQGLKKGNECRSNTAKKMKEQAGKGAGSRGILDSG